MKIFLVIAGLIKCSLVWHVPVAMIPNHANLYLKLEMHDASQIQDQLPDVPVRAAGRWS